MLFFPDIPTAPDASTYNGLPQDMDNWSCDNWKTYYLNMKALYGQTQALQIFETDASGCDIFAPINNCKYSCDWVDFFKGEGVTDIGNIFSNLLCTGSTVVTDVEAVATNVASTAKTVTRPVVLVGLGIGFLGFMYYMNKHK